MPTRLPNSAVRPFRRTLRAALTVAGLTVAGLTAVEPARQDTTAAAQRDADHADDRAFDLTPYVLAWTEQPPFVEALAPGEVELSLRPVCWGARAPGLTVVGLTSDWPEAVEARLLARAKARFWVDSTPPDEVMAAEVGGDWPRALRAARTVLSSGLEVYALAHSFGGTFGSGLTLLAHDPVTGAIIDEPLTLVQRWTATYGAGPSAWVADLDGDGPLELAVRVTHHNGTIEQGTGRAWLRIGADLSWVEVARTIDEEEVRVVSREDEGRVRSRLVRTLDGALREDAWFENPKFGITPRSVTADVVARIHGSLASCEVARAPLPSVR